MTFERSSKLLARRVLLRQCALGAGAFAIATGFRASLAYAAGPTHVVAKTNAGRVRGLLDAGVNVFKGIPYGADTARCRFRRAPPPDAWKRVRDALEYGPACPQLRSAEQAS